MQAVDPAVDDDLLAALPGFLDDGRLADVERLLDDVELAQRVDALGRRGTVSSQAPCRLRTSWTWRSQLSARPTRRSSSAAMTPPHCEWPTTMMWRTLRTSVANWMTDRQLRSEWTTTLATLRWTNSSPGARSTSSLAGTRLSAQPIHRYCGACCWSRPLKKPGRAGFHLLRPEAIVLEQFGQK